MTKEEPKQKKVGRPEGSKKVDNVQLNMRYPRTLDELVRADGVPSDVITPILMRHYGLSENKQYGPDYHDGHDCEGFVGGCDRFGCPGGYKCTYIGGNKK